MIGYQYFGSADSTDTDVVFFVAELPPTIQERSILCKAIVSRYFKPASTAKRINANLAVLKEGQVVQVYKGTVDELNNALYDTYALHEQDFENQVRQRLPRNVDLKMIRCNRVLLSALSRTIFRKTVKQALQADLPLRIAPLKQINLQQLTTTEKGLSITDIKKMMAFQLGQTLALIKGKEIYTKQAIADCYPQLSPYLQREEGTDTKELSGLLGTFIQTLEDNIKTLKFTEEGQYGTETQ